MCADAHGLARDRFDACGCALGAKFTPSWMDLPMCYERNAFVIAAGQVYFLHMILMDSDSGAAMCLGDADLVGVHHVEPLNAANLDLAVK
jgi:Xaa-Pro dipeptidase